MSVVISSAYKTLGFHRTPAEWEYHSCTWMGWPHRPDNWRHKAKHAQEAFVEVATAISKYETVKLCVPPSEMSNALSILPSTIHVIEMSMNDAWFRDTSPTFVRTSDGTLAGVDWEFNAWGGIYSNFEYDNQIAERITDIANCPRIISKMVLEGGSIIVDGEGTLITTEECLLNPNRNPEMNKDDIERTLKEYLNIQTVIWLPFGLVGDDDTNGHIDNICCFTEPGSVLLAWTNDMTDPQYERSIQALHILQNSVDAKGQSFNVRKLILPPPMYIKDEDMEGLDIEYETYENRYSGKRLAASYVNMYICNGAVIVPCLSKETDDIAKQTIQEAFSGRDIVMIERSKDILLGGGNIHCITSQQPYCV